MTKKSRYLILSACIVFFILAAPALLLYVRGIGYDTETGNFYKTGILAVKSEPKEIDIKLDGKLYKKGAGNLRFIKPKEYLVALEKAGYQTWSKRLNVEAGKVTWTNPAGQNIFLFFDKPGEKTVDKKGTAFVQSENRLFYLSGKRLMATSLSSPEKQDSYDLAFEAIGLTAVPGGKLLAIHTADPKTPWQIFDGAYGAFLPLGQNLGEKTQVKYQDGNKLYVLEDSTLFFIDLKSQKKTLVLAGVADLIYKNGYFYYLAAKNGSLALLYTPDMSQPGALLAENMPMAESARILLNSEKQAFVLLDQNLYQIASKPVLIAENVTSLELNSEEDTLGIISGSEFLRMNVGAEKPELVSRSLYPLSKGLVLPDYGYGIFLKENKVVAEELDTRDHQNEFTLYTGSELKDYAISADAKTLIVLDGTSLKILTLR